MTIISAHREPDVFFDYAKTAEEKGFKVIIAGAGMAAHLTRNVRSDLPDAGHRNSDAHYIYLAEEIPCTPSYRCHPVFR